MIGFVVVVVALLVGARPTAGQLTTGDATNLQLLVNALGALFAARSSRREGIA